jgi:hypothetical protein
MLTFVAPTGTLIVPLGRKSAANLSGMLARQLAELAAADKCLIFVVGRARRYAVQQKRSLFEAETIQFSLMD